MQRVCSGLSRQNTALGKKSWKKKKIILWGKNLFQTIVTWMGSILTLILFPFHFISFVKRVRVKKKTGLATLSY